MMMSPILIIYKDDKGRYHASFFKYFSEKMMYLKMLDLINPV